MKILRRCYRGNGCYSIFIFFIALSQPLLISCGGPDDAVVQKLRNLGHEVRIGNPSEEDSRAPDGTYVLSVTLKANIPVSESLFAEICAIETLTTLHASSAAINDRHLETLTPKSLLNLKRLNLSHSAIGDDGVSKLSNLPELRWLDLQHTKVTDVGVSRLVGLPSLAELDLSYTKITSISFALQFKNLRTLRLNECKDLKNGFLGIGELPKLTNLSVSGVSMTLKDVSEIATSKSIEYFFSENAGLTDEMASRLFAIKTIRGISFLGSPIYGDFSLDSDTQLQRIEFLGFAGTKFKDENVPALRGLKSLEQLFFESTSISNEGIKSLSEMKRLRTLGLKRTRVTLEGIERLKKSIPGLEVWH